MIFVRSHVVFCRRQGLYTLSSLIEAAVDSFDILDAWLEICTDFRDKTMLFCGQRDPVPRRSDGSYSMTDR
jgi:hypothetical protein